MHEGMWFAIALVCAHALQARTHLVLSCVQANTVSNVHAGCLK
jgi:hypothetical protein